jgi:aquaporin Z
MSHQILNLPSRPYSVTQLSPSASLAQALKIHWREYLMGGCRTGCAYVLHLPFGTLLYSSASPLTPLDLSRIGKGFLMGIAVAITTFLIIPFPFGRRTGAHFNPAITLTYFYLGRVHRWDTLC